MNLKAYFTKDKLKATIDYMPYARTREELNILLADAMEELLDYQIKLKEEIECDNLTTKQCRDILNSVYDVCNKK